MSRLTQKYEDGTYGAANDLPCGENSYAFKDLLIEKLGRYESMGEPEDFHRCINVTYYAQNPTVDEYNAREELQRQARIGRAVEKAFEVASTIELYKTIFNINQPDECEFITDFSRVEELVKWAGEDQ